jgi:predicted signal transduction protein with EAL and GGDEF domain
VLRDDDLVTRLGGDEFAILVTGSMVEAEEVAGRVVDALSMPHRTDEWAFAIGASVGVAPLEVAGGQSAFRKADDALRAAKQAGKGCVRIADTTPETQFGAIDVPQAILDGNLFVRFDSAVDADGTIRVLHGIPAWDHPVYGSFRGQDLWGATERHGRSVELQEWLLHQACAEVAALPDPTIVVAVSLPAGHVTAESLADQVASALAQSGLPPERLMLSVTEETLLTSSAALVPELEAAHATGVQICLDNYGMGHSIFALLARLSLDTVRVDLAALGARDDTERALRVLTAIVRTTAEFGLSTVAGGISTPELRTAAMAAGVTYLNGRLLPQDLSVAEVAALLGTPLPAAI